MAKPKLGSGKRFAAGEEKIEAKGISKKEAGAIMAKEGREKYGNSKMTAMAVAGRKRAEPKEGRHKMGSVKLTHRK